MSKTITPHFPVTIEDLRANPAIAEHWPHLARPIIGFLLTQLHGNAINSGCAERAQAEAAKGQSFSILINNLMTLGDAEPVAPLATMRPLHRFSAETKAVTETPNPTEK